MKLHDPCCKRKSWHEWKLLVKRCIFLGGIVVLLAFRGTIALAQAPERLWSIDLFQNKDFEKRLGVSELFLDSPSLGFLNDSQIICDFYDLPQPGYKLTAHLPGYHVLEISTKDGTLGRELDFQPIDDQSRALPIEDGGFVVFTGRDLIKFSSEFVRGNSYSIGRDQAGDSMGRWLVDIAPSLQTILLYHLPAEVDAPGRWTWLSTKDFSVVKSLQSSRATIVKTSDSAAILNSFADRRLLNAPSPTPICIRCNAYFITDDLLFVDREESYFIQTVDGVRRAAGRLNIQALDFARAAHAPRVAFLTGRYGGWGFPLKSHFNTLNGKFIVLDWNTNKRVGEIELAEPVENPSAGFNQTALALSPDGKYLAVLLHHTLSLYRLP